MVGDRVEEYRRVLSAMRASRQPRSSVDHGLDAEVLAEALASALGRFTTEDGALKVADQRCQSVVG